MVIFCSLQIHKLDTVALDLVHLYYILTLWEVFCLGGRQNVSNVLCSISSLLVLFTHINDTTTWTILRIGLPPVSCLCEKIIWPVNYTSSVPENLCL